MAAVSGSRDTPVWCMVYDGMGYTEEADTVAKQQKFVKLLMPYEIFMANIDAGNNDQILIKSPGGFPPAADLLQQRAKLRMRHFHDRVHLSPLWP